MRKAHLFLDFRNRYEDITNRYPISVKDIFGFYLCQAMSSQGFLNPKVFHFFLVKRPLCRNKIFILHTVSRKDVLRGDFLTVDAARNGLLRIDVLLEHRSEACVLEEELPWKSEEGRQTVGKVGSMQRRIILLFIIYYRYQQLFNLGGTIELTESKQIASTNAKVSVMPDPRGAVINYKQENNSPSQPLHIGIPIKQSFCFAQGSLVIKYYPFLRRTEAKRKKIF